MLVPPSKVIGIGADPTSSSTSLKDDATETFDGFDSTGGENDNSNGPGGNKSIPADDKAASNKSSEALASPKGIPLSN